MTRKLEVLRHLRRGGVGDIFEAEEQLEGDIRRTVVMKRLRPDRRETDEQAFLDEARILAQLSHPGVIRLLGVERIDGDLVQVLEHIDGRSLAEWVATGLAAGSPLPISSLLHVVDELARTLDYVHSAVGRDRQPLAIVHRDLSPHNVFLTRQGQVRLLDFGLARSTDRRERTQIGVAKGTEGFMAPEQLLGESIDHRSDLYVLGLLICFMIEGASPLADPEIQKRALMGEAPEPPPHCPGELKALIGRLLEPDPIRRPKDAAAVVRVVASIRSRLRAPEEPELRTWLNRVDAETSLEPIMANAHPLAGLFDLPIESEVPARGQTRRIPRLEPALVPALGSTVASEATSETWSPEVSSTLLREPPEAPTRVDPPPGDDQVTWTVETSPRSFVPFPSEPGSQTWSRPDLTAHGSDQPAKAGLRLKLLAAGAVVIAVASVLMLAVFDRPLGVQSRGPVPATERESDFAAQPRGAALRAIAEEPPSSPAREVSEAHPEVQEDPSEHGPRPRARRSSGSGHDPVDAPTSPPQAAGDPAGSLANPNQATEPTVLMERFGRMLRSAKDELSPDELRSFEKSYLDLRLRSAANLEPTAKAELSAVIQSEMSRLARAIGASASP